MVFCIIMFIVSRPERSILALYPSSPSFNHSRIEPYHPYPVASCADW